MVSFSCEVCNDTVKKPKLDAHKGRCQGAYFTCIDCSTTFRGGDYRAHTSCISEAQKYQGALYKPEKGKGKGRKNGQDANGKTEQDVKSKSAVLNASNDQDVVPNAQEAIADIDTPMTSPPEEDPEPKQERAKTLLERKSDARKRKKERKERGREARDAAAAGEEPAAKRARKESAEMQVVAEEVTVEKPVAEKGKKEKEKEEVPTAEEVIAEIPASGEPMEKVAVVKKSKKPKKDKKAPAAPTETVGEVSASVETPAPTEETPVETAATKKSKKSKNPKEIPAVEEALAKTPASEEPVAATKSKKSKKDKKAKEVPTPIAPTPENSTEAVEETLGTPALGGSTKAVEEAPAAKKSKKSKKSKKPKNEDGPPLATKEAPTVSTEIPTETPAAAEETPVIKKPKRSKETLTEPEGPKDKKRKLATTTTAAATALTKKVRIGETAAIAESFLAIFQDGEPHPLEQALKTLQEEHGADVRARMVAVLRGTEIVLSIS